MNVTHGGVFPVHGPSNNRCLGSKSAPMGIVSSSEVLYYSSLPEALVPVWILKRVPLPSHYSTTTKLASILDSIIAEVGDGGRWNRLLRFVPQGASMWG